MMLLGVGRRQAIISLARDEHHKEGDCEIDDDALFDEGESNGCYVQAWVWVSFEGTQFDKEKTA